jgi:hypothetical protein
MRFQRLTFLAGAALALIAAPRVTRAQQAGFATAVGVAYDSIRAQPMAGAQVQLEGTTRVVVADEGGHFRIDSIPPGMHRLIVAHPVLDSIGIHLVSPPHNFAAGESATFQMVTPSPGRLVELLCPAARRALGPAALFGRVRYADSDDPATDARVSLVWYEFDVTGLRKIPRVRESPVDKDGTYRICGLPKQFDGKVQVLQGGVTSGDLPISFQDEDLELRSMSIPRLVAAAHPGADTGKAAAPAKVAATARLIGRVVNTTGKPVAGARVQLDGTTRATSTGVNGAFTLDSLPAGSQVVTVRLLGYTPADKPVELSSVSATNVTITLDNFVPVLSTVRVEAQRTRALDDVGFTERKRSGFGYYMDEKQIDNRQAIKFTELLRQAPGIRIMPAGDGSGANVITDARDPNGCVNIVVDGSPWVSQSPGDIDSFVQPQEIGAIEVYSGVTTPAQFGVPGQSGCETVVVWTKFRLDRNKSKR